MDDTSSRNEDDSILPATDTKASAAPEVRVAIGDDLDDVTKAGNELLGDLSCFEHDGLLGVALARPRPNAHVP